MCCATIFYHWFNFPCARALTQRKDDLMSLVELFLIAVGLSMDAFAVAICKGLGMKHLNMRQAAVIGLFFGGFQMLMPTIGWVLGAQFASFVTPIDHWIAFILLAFVGGKMLVEAIRDDDEDEVAEAST